MKDPSGGGQSAPAKIGRMSPTQNLRTDVLVVGAGPAGSSAAAWASRHGRQVVLADAAQFPRDKTCGDGLTPRAVAELERLGMQSFLAGRVVNFGLRAHGFGQTLHLPWNGPNLPGRGSAAPRMELDAAIRDVALASGAGSLDGARAVAVEFDGAKLAAVVFDSAGQTLRVTADTFIVADGAKSQLGRMLGREWHQDTVYGVAARGYVTSGKSTDPWISSHLELRGSADEILSGYGWIFPLGGGKVNIGVGTLATTARPADINLRQLLNLYADQQRAGFELGDVVSDQKSALLPMGGAVSGVAGPNWLLIGDAAGCVNPLNGEGIDYGLETGRLAAEFIAGGRADCSGWAAELKHEYGEAFSIARRLAGILTNADFLRLAGPVGMRSRWTMEIALRLMGNLVTAEDRDWVARVWRKAGRWSVQNDQRPPFS